LRLRAAQNISLLPSFSPLMIAIVTPKSTAYALIAIRQLALG